MDLKKKMRKLPRYKFILFMETPIFADRKSLESIEKAAQFAPKFDSAGLIPAMAVDHKTRMPLMLAYMNEESLKKTLEIGEAVYYSRSRQELWHKGATSGHVQVITQILTDCDQDALILLVEQKGEGACHTGYYSCFYREVAFGDALKSAPDGQPVALSPVLDGPSFDAESVYKK